MVRRARYPVVALLIAVLQSQLAAGPALAGEPLPAPTGKAVLEISGRIVRANADGKAVFDWTMLDRMATETLETGTPWTDGTQLFEGIALGRLLAAVGAEGSVLRAAALNDYVATMPIAETVAAGAFLAVRRNGRPMPVRERGPLWIVFPYDKEARLSLDPYLNRSVWQLKALEVR